jgi:hypothetical protein
MENTTPNPAQELSTQELEQIAGGSSYDYPAPSAGEYCGDSWYRGAMDKYMGDMKTPYQPEEKKPMVKQDKYSDYHEYDSNHPG